MRFISLSTSLQELYQISWRLTRKSVERRWSNGKELKADNDLNNKPALPAREKYYFVRTFYNN